jgi:hypothetical protein
VVGLFEILDLKAHLVVTIPFGKIEQIMEMLKAMQEKADAVRKADREDLKEMIKAGQ